MSYSGYLRAPQLRKSDHGQMTRQNSKESEHLLRGFRYLLRFFRICGIAAFSVRVVASNKRKGEKTLIFSHSKLEAAYNIVLTCCFVVGGVLSLPRIYGMYYPNRTAVNRVVDVVQAFIGLCSLYTPILTHAFGQRTVLRIIYKILDVDRSLVRFDSFASKMSFPRCLALFLSHFFLWNVFMIISELVFLENVIITWVTLYAPMFVTYWFFNQYTMAVILVKRRFETVNRALCDLTAVGEVEEPAVLSRYILRSNPSVAQLRTLECAHYSLCEICYDLENFYSLSTLVGMGFYFITLTYAAYFLVVPFIVTPSEGVDTMTSIQAGIWIATVISPMITLSFNVTMIINETKKTGQVVHALLSRTLKREVAAELRRFSLQLLHHDVRFTGYGLFPLDLPLMHSIMHSTATYLVILVQFHAAGAE